MTPIRFNSDSKSTIKAYSTDNSESVCVQDIKRSVVVEKALVLLNENGNVPFYYGTTTNDVYLVDKKVTYIVSPDFIKAVKKAAQSAGFNVSLQPPLSLGIYLNANVNQGGIILVKEHSMEL